MRRHQMCTQKECCTFEPRSKVVLHEVEPFLLGQWLRTTHAQAFPGKKLLGASVAITSPCPDHVCASKIRQHLKLSNIVITFFAQARAGNYVGQRLRAPSLSRHLRGLAQA